MTEITKENDASLDLEEDISDDTGEVIEKGEIAIGSYNSHLNTAKKGLFEYKVWWSLTSAVLAMAKPNNYHRIDLRDKETLKRLEKDLDATIDYQAIESAILKDPYLISKNGTRAPVDRTKDDSGKPLTKKAIKIMARRDKAQVKIDAMKKKYKAIKNKKCNRAINLTIKIDELEKKRDRIL
jgi:hypothetical protein